MLLIARRLLLPFTGTILLLIPALINAYPMIYSDTSTHLASGFVLEPPMDRPLTYGLFMRFFSLNGLSLWPVIFAQSFILSWLIWQLVIWILKEKQGSQGPVFLAMLAIASFSGAGWTACYLIPDVFTPIMLLSATLILLSQADRRRNTIYYILYGISAAMHSSHIPIGMALLSIALVVSLLFRKKTNALINLRPLLILMTLTLVSILAMGSSLSKSRHVFLMGAFIEQGIIKAYLDENCGLQAYELCVYKDSLPEHAWEFIWQDSSPLYKMGGWKETKEEYSAIIRETYFSPKFFTMHAMASIRASLQQLVRFKALDYKGVAPNATVLQTRVERYVPGDLKHFIASKQNLGQLGAFKGLNLLQLVLVVLSCALLLITFAFSRNLQKNRILLLTGLILFLGIIINAWVCGTFANPINRLGNRMIWLIPAYTILLLSSKGRIFLK